MIKTSTDSKKINGSTEGQLKTILIKNKPSQTCDTHTHTHTHPSVEITHSYII